LSGVLDDSTVEEFREKCQLLCDTSKAPFVIDMANVSFVDSDGFGALILLQKQLTEAKRRLALIGCQESVRSALHLTRLEILLPCFNTVSEFRQSMRDAAPQLNTHL